MASTDKGIRSLSINKKVLLNKADTSGVSGGVDGLELYQGNLFAVQNEVKRNGDNFRKLFLNDSRIDIIRAEAIDGPNPELNVPLTFCVAGNSAVVIANSNLQFLNQNSLEIRKDGLKKTKLKVYELK